MSVKMPQTILKLALLVSIASSPGCALFGDKKSKPVLSRHRVYFAPVTDVERAMKQSMIRYPQRVDNPEAGIFETDWIKGEQRFQAAHQNVEYSDGYRYRLLVRLIKGKSTAKPAVKVIVSKNIELQRDFFSEPEPVPSDGLEETIILYRIQRELALERAIRRAQEKANSAPDSAPPADDDPSASQEN